MLVHVAGGLDSTPVVGDGPKPAGPGDEGRRLAVGVVDDLLQAGLPLLELTSGCRRGDVGLGEAVVERLVADLASAVEVLGEVPFEVPGHLKFRDSFRLVDKWWCPGQEL